MVNNELEPEVLNVSSLLNNGSYIIPLYQRAYAWTNIEIEQLLNDILQRCTEDPQSKYFIGNLVVSKKSNGDYEIIDGQQRHTTLTLINLTVKHLFPNQPLVAKELNLNFEGRVPSGDLIEKYLISFDEIFAFDDRPGKTKSLANGIKDILHFFRVLNKNEAVEKVEKFISYLYDNVCVIRIPLPEKTNLNQYFEIMNNRGEQLEPHEILKATLLGTLKYKDENTRKAFAIAWDACSQMDRYIQTCFTGDIQTNIFGPSLNEIPKDYLMTTADTVTTIVEDSKNELMTILGEPYLYNADKKQDVSPETRYQSIINFPNFLLHVLRLHLSDDSVSLDDKRLLHEFGCDNKKKRALPNAINFINDLIYYRTIFDRYIIKREEEATGSTWKILKFIKGNYLNVFDNTQPIVMLQSMFQASFTSNNYKNWLQTVLALFKESPAKDEITFNSALLKISQDIFSQTSKNLENGTDTPIYLFNYLDFRLWQIYKALNDSTYDKSYVSDEVLIQIKENAGVFNNFRFRQNNSVEHVAPQRPDTDHNHHVHNLDNFGNLCLISRSSNSKYSNAVFESKKEYFEADVKENRVESLKQTLIFSHQKWKDNEILKHGGDMINILFKERIATSLQELVEYLKKEYPQKTIGRNNKPVPQFLYRGERTIDWTNSSTTYSRNLQGQPLFDDVNYLLTGQHPFLPYQYQEHSLYHFLREAIYDIGVVSKENYEAEIDVYLAGIFQHYGFDTNLLDLTDAMEIAASFAAWGNPGDIGQIMLLETQKIEGYYYELKGQFGHRALRQNAYGLLGTVNLDLKSKDFINGYQPKWFKFILTQQDKNKFTNNEMLNITDDPVVPLILEWWELIGEKDSKVSLEAKCYINKKIDSLR
ncbi:DUF262 domain-containing protein [Chitinophaga oryziterrae]|uniref:DUF262 domain-containing protein n=1 Tax=Chitinophaga oryziterrae TaxID=1031224 RepID=A0A6N8JL09_9BACT|nr:DUF262 domain-containing protein [Chitinophaga oryziterrae]MVT44852.1 DUF262 domain-containing protein [Chitinophaga oryziterrae]